MYNFTYESLFKVIAGSQKNNATIKKDDFVLCLQGMDLKLSVDEINDFFNYCDQEEKSNRINKNQFINAITFVQSKLGGQSYLEQQLVKGTQTVKKGTTNTAFVLSVIKIICDGIQNRKLNIKQLALSMDVNGTGFVSRPEFVSVCQQLSDVATLDQIRALTNFLDDKNTGKVSVQEFLRVCTETLNSQIGGGVFSFMQVQPVIQKIINELSVDCDRFFDEVADANEKYIEHELKDR